MAEKTPPLHRPTMSEFFCFTADDDASPVRCIGQFAQHGRLLPIRFDGRSPEEVREIAAGWIRDEAEKEERRLAGIVARAAARERRHG